jgi:hypothetical protein
MGERIEFQGNYSASNVTKKQVRAVIQTVKQRIEGTVYVLPNRRVLDEFSLAAGFIPVTNARIMEGGNIQTADFVAVSVSHIVWVLEVL